MADHPIGAAELAAFRRDDERNSTLYRTLVAEHGLSHRALNWGSRESQETRFRVIAGIGIDPEASILDVGCGTGDFLAYLRRMGHRGAYTGIDLTPAMVETARQRFPDARFAVATLLDWDTGAGADFVVASGLFYSRREAPETYMAAAVERMFTLCAKGLAFNSLSSFADRPAAAAEFRADPLAVVQACRRLTPFVALRHDYHPGDFTLYLRRLPESAQHNPGAG
jgi:SAM-dependent methyltransferase